MNIVNRIADEDGNDESQELKIAIEGRVIWVFDYKNLDEEPVRWDYKDYHKKFA